ncbi:hypothetical protein Tco_0759101 [Tanacetum coccineum]
MILEGSELTKDDRESQLYDEFEHFCQIKGETIHVYYVRFTKLINDMRNIKMTMARMQLNSKFVNNMLPEWSRFITEVKLNKGLKESNFDQLTSSNARNKAMVQDGKVVVQDVRGRYNANNQGRPFQRNNARGNVVAGNARGQTRDGNVTNFDDDVDDLTLNVDHVFEADQCDAFDSDVDEAPTTQTMFMVNLSSEDPIYDEAGPSYDSNTPFEVQDHDTFVDHMDEYHEVHEMQSDVQHNYVVDSDADYTSDSNIIPYDQYVEDNEEHVVQSNVSSVRNDALMSILDEMHEQGVQSRLANKPDMVVNDSVTSELARYKELVGEYEKRAKFELTDRERKIDEQMRIIISDRNRKETSLKSELHSAQILLSSTVGHYKSKTEEVTILKKDFKQKEDKFLEEFLDIKRLKDKIEDRLYKQDQSVQTVHMLCKPKSFYDEKHKVAIGYKNPLCLTRAKQAQSALYNGHVLVTTNHTPTVIHDSEDTREIAEITRKRMLREYVIGTCPKSFNERDNKAPSTPVTRKKQVTFNDKPGTSSSNTQKHKVHQKVQQTNIPVIPSTGVNTSTEASGSKPRSNTKHDRILPAKSANKKKVEDHPRTNKSVWTKVNRVDSSISSKRVVINSNSESVCKTCNKCLNSANHEMCVVNILNSVNATPTVKTVLNNGKQIWKPKGKLSNNSLNKTKRVWKATGKLFTNVGYQWRPTGKKFTLGKLNCGYQWRPTRKKFALGELCPLTRLPVTCGTDHLMVFGLRLFKTYDGESLKAQELCEKVHQDGNNHVGAIMGYGDYMIGVSAVSRAYYVEGLGHNLFSVGQFCDSDLEVAFRKHSCFVRNMDGVDILKGLAPSPVPATTYIPPTDKDLEILFQPMFDEYFDQSTDSEPVPTATVVNAPIVSTNTSVSTTIAQDAPSTSHSLSSSQVHPPVFPQGVTAGPTIEDTLITQADLHPLVNPVAGEPSSAQSTSGDVSLAEPNQVNQPPDHLRKWTKDHPLDNIVERDSICLVQPSGFEELLIYPTHVYRIEEGSLWVSRLQWACASACDRRIILGPQPYTQNNHLEAALSNVSVRGGGVVDRDEGGGNDVDGSVVVASDGGDGEGGVEMMPAAGQSWPEVAEAAAAAEKEMENGSWRIC